MAFDGKDKNMTPIIAGFVPMPLLMATLFLPICWLIAEFKANRRTRIALGLLSLALLTLSVSETRLIMPTYTIHFQQASLVRANELLQQGRTNFVSDALLEYKEAILENKLSQYQSAGQLYSNLTKPSEGNSSNQ